MAPVAFGFMSKARCGLMSGVSPKRCVGVATFVQFRPFFGRCSLALFSFGAE